MMEFNPQELTSKVNEEQGRGIVSAIEVTSKGNYKVHVTEEEEASLSKFRNGRATSREEMTS
jgi:hypothetical protein